jgi:hypothetical protein
MFCVNCSLFLPLHGTSTWILNYLLLGLKKEESHFADLGLRPISLLYIKNNTAYFVIHTAMPLVFRVRVVPSPFFFFFFNYDRSLGISKPKLGSFLSFFLLLFFFKNRAPMMSKREDIIYLDVVPISEALQL